VVLADIARLYATHRRLIWELAKRDLRDRFAGQFFGVVWAVGHPLVLTALYVLVFVYIFPGRSGGDAVTPRDLTISILSGLIPWLAFQEVLANSATVIRNNASLVKQIVFPIEVLPVKAVLASTVSQLVATVFLIFYALARGALESTLLLWPLLFGLQLLAMAGACYLLSAIGVFFRDLKDLIQIFCAANLFLQPILYVPDQLPRAFRAVFYANPFSYVVWCYQDAVFVGEIAHPWAWIVYAVGSVVVFYLGFRAFRKMKIGFGDVL
jgi:lipopolysaccharide transport system permease protein